MNGQCGIFPHSVSSWVHSLHKMSKIEMLSEHQYLKTYINTLTYIRGNRGHMLWSKLERMHGFSVPNILKVEFLPGELNEQRGLAGYSPWGHKELDRTEQWTLWLFRQMNAGGIYCTLYLFVSARVATQCKVFLKVRYCQNHKLDFRIYKVQKRLSLTLGRHGGYYIQCEHRSRDIGGSPSPSF